MIPFPTIDPVAIEILGLPVRWYGLAYVAGFILGLQYLKVAVGKGWARLTTKQIDDLFIWVVAGVIIGGRVGYTLFYHFSYFMENPLYILRIWEGGMSFHGGLLGVAVAGLLFCRKHKVSAADVADTIAPAIPIGLFFGRIANFINAELWGRTTDAPWGMVFPTDPTGLARHPSQLYEAVLEGLVLFILLLFIAHTNPPKWRLTGVFLAGYGFARIGVEFFRQPDNMAQLQGGIYTYITQGQLLSLPMVIIGLWLVSLSMRQQKS